MPPGSPSGLAKPLAPVAEPGPYPDPVSGHTSSGSDLENVPFDVGQDDAGSLGWTTSSDFMYSSWTSLGLESLPALGSMDPLSSSVDAAALGRITINDTADTVASPPPKAGVLPWTDRADLCQQLADLSHSLSRDVQALLTGPRLAAPQHPSSSSLASDGASLTRRTFKSFEILGSLLDQLRSGRDAPAVLLASTGARRPSARAQVEPADFHLNMVMALHIVTSYKCLNHILKHTLRLVHATAAQGAAPNGAMGQLPRLPEILVEGLPGTSDHLRVRLFAETCVHVTTGLQKRLEALAAADAVGAGFSRPIEMALGRGLSEDSGGDVRDIRTLCSQISSAIEEQAW